MSKLLTSFLTPYAISRFVLRTSRPSQNNLYHHELSYGISKIRFAGHRLIQIYFQLALATAMLLSISSLSRFNASSPAARRSAISTFSLAASSPLIEIDHYGERLIRLHRVQSLGLGQRGSNVPPPRASDLLKSCAQRATLATHFQW